MSFRISEGLTQIKIGPEKWFDDNIENKVKVEKIDIPNPCLEDVELMDGLGSERYCDQCEKNVHNLSELTQDEADELLAKGKDLCISYKSTHRGEVVFRQEDDPRPSFSQLEGVKKLLSSAAIVAMFISQPALVPGRSSRRPRKCRPN